jgi:hypothetical protein
LSLSFFCGLHPTGFHVIDTGLNGREITACEGFLHLPDNIRVDDDERLVDTVTLTWNAFRMLDGLLGLFSRKFDHAPSLH